ncbi:uncharacterized protein [Rutidosis leptorrhynchoides]|uniref:uncharacterized protein n=1 Tax=Rutidosis leptorrhynchoides TaxID=125765 RepID=UPI003A9A5CA2
MALIGKWWWRFKTETTSLWVKVISSIYGPSGRLFVGVPFHSDYYKSVWIDILKNGDNIYEIGVPFRNLFAKVLGDGGSTSFWNNPWIGNDVLKDKFKRLWRLDTEASALVKDRVIWNGSNWVGNWSWVREPSGCAGGELQSLSELIKDVVLNAEKKDSWRWTLSSNGVFTTSGLATLINSRLLTSSNMNGETLHNNLVPKSGELDKRGIDLNSVRCPLCDDDIETVGKGWDSIYQCGGLVHGLGLSYFNVGKVIWQAMAWTCAYLIWKNRNQKVFSNKCWNTPVALNIIQVTSFDWMRKDAKEKLSYGTIGYITLKALLFEASY